MIKCFKKHSALAVCAVGVATLSFYITCNLVDMSYSKDESSCEVCVTYSQKTGRSVPTNVDPPTVVESPAAAISATDKRAVAGQGGAIVLRQGSDGLWQVFQQDI